MVLITKILKKKIITYPLIFFVLISCIGLFNSSWYSLIIYQILFLLFFAAKINFNKKYWLIVTFLVPITVFTKQSIEIPKIVQGSNVFIGGDKYNDSIFKEKLPKNFQKSEYLFDKGMIDIVIHRKNLKKKLSQIICLLLNK